MLTIGEKSMIREWLLRLAGLTLALISYAQFVQAEPVTGSNGPIRWIALDTNQTTIPQKAVSQDDESVALVTRAEFLNKLGRLGEIKNSDKPQVVQYPDTIPVEATIAPGDYWEGMKSLLRGIYPEKILSELEEGPNEHCLEGLFGTDWKKIPHDKRLELLENRLSETWRLIPEHIQIGWECIDGIIVGTACYFVPREYSPPSDLDYFGETGFKKFPQVLKDGTFSGKRCIVLNPFACQNLRFQSTSMLQYKGDSLLHVVGIVDQHIVLRDLDQLFLYDLKNKTFRRQVLPKSLPTSYRFEMDMLLIGRTPYLLTVEYPDKNYQNNYRIKATCTIWKGSFALN